jgi:hypothetical protein
MPPLLASLSPRTKDDGHLILNHAAISLDKMLEMEWQTLV